MNHTAEARDTGGLRYWLAALMALTMMGGTFAVLWLITAFRVALGTEGRADAAADVLTDPLNLAGAQLVGALVALAWAKAVTGEEQPTGEWLRLYPERFRTLALAFMSGGAFQFVLTEIGNWVHHVFPVSVAEQQRLAELFSPSSWIGGASLVIAIVAVAPLTEEALFRGAILPGLARRYGKVLAVLLSALLFGLVHGGSSVVYATVGGLVLGVVSIQARSLWVPIAMHAGVNATPVLLSPAVLPLPGFNQVSETVVHLHPGLVFGALVLSLACLLGALRMAEPNP